MIASLLLSFVALQLLTVAKCDIYMHNLRGCNNRLDENTQNRRTGNRIFDSQNNNKGGYNVGDRTHEKASTGGSTAGIDAKQYKMEYFESKPGQPSKINLEWTNQHGCGGDENTNPNKVNCNFVLQFMCQPDADTIGPDTLRTGVNTKRNNYKDVKTGENSADFLKRKTVHNKEEHGMHERFEWYDKCTQRERNKGLFTADQDMNRRDRAKNTRQNRNGNRNGYECPEERDYYPYWHPTDWKDVAVFAGNASMCSYYVKNSFNTHPKYECVENWGDGKPKHYSRHNNEKDCTTNSGEWVKFNNYLEKAKDIKTEDACTTKGYTWGRPLYGYAKECLVPLSAPHCEASPWTRVNHLGNGATGDLQTPTYVWSLPHFPSDTTHRCVFRIRYNISTDDYDPWRTFSDLNGDKSYNWISNDPKVDIGASNHQLQLNLNTAQTGRTFQDRSHVFKIRPRPAGASGTIHNIVVRGKRGNVVQTFPAVEYDFSPTTVEISTNDYVHFQWTGSNSHNNRGGGDGQAGDAGEGTGGTDRSNVLPMANRNHNFPVLSETPNIFTGATVHWSASAGHHSGYSLKFEDIFLQHASAGHYVCGTCPSPHSLKLKGKSENKMDGKLNKAPASYGGMLLKLKPGVYQYMCTRNNNFSNRSQKGTVTVIDTSSG